MTPDAAGRPERSDLTVDQHRMVAPSRVWLMPPPGDPTWYAGTWKSNPLTVVVGDIPYVPEAEVQRLRAEVEALVDRIEEHDDVLCCESVDGSHEWVMFPGTMRDFITALLAARKEDEV